MHNHETSLQHTGIQFITVSNPIQTLLRYVVKGDEVVITRDTMDGTNTNLVKAPKKIFGKIHRTGQGRSAEIGRHELEGRLLQQLDSLLQLVEASMD